MTHWFTAFGPREAKKARALRVRLRVELLEARNLLASGLVLVASPPISPAQLVGAAAISASDIWAVGSQSSQAPLAEHFDGTSWRVVSTPSPRNFSALKGVAAAASNDVWAVGVGGTNNATLIEHWNGTNWSEVPSPTMPTGSELKAVTAPATNNAWAIGINSQSNNALVEHWDGTSWSVVSSPAFTGETILSAGGNISADSTTDVWVVGAQGNTNTGAPFNGGASLHWNGQTWSVISGPTFSQAVTALSPTNVWGAGFRGEFFHHPDRTIEIPVVEHWDGTSWSIVPSPNPNGTSTTLSSRLNGIAAISANDIWAVGSSAGGTLTEHWNGMDWKVVKSPNPGQSNFLSGVTALSDGTVAAVGFQFSLTTGTTPLVLQNAASAPKTATTAALLAASATTAGITTAAQAATLPPPANAALLDPFFATPTRRTTPAALDAGPVQQFHVAAGMAIQPLKFAALSSKRHQAAAIWNLDLLPQGIWLVDPN